MQIEIDYAQEHLALEIAEAHRLAAQQQPPADTITDLSAAVARALEEPVGFPPLRKALTPDDHVTVVIDDQLAPRSEYLAPLFDHLAEAQVPPSAVTLLFRTEASREQWAEVLANAGRGAAIAVHDPHERKELSYLATTEAGRRIYLSRTVVEAEQLVILSRRSYDPLLGYSGAEGALFPALTDEPTQLELSGMLSMAAPDEEDWPVRDEAREVSWLLGAPFLLQIIEGPGDSIAHVVGGTTEASEYAEELLDARWRITVPQPVDTVIAAISGDPSRHTFADLARALAAAVRIVKPQGRIVVLSRAGGELGPGAEVLRQTEDPEQVLERLGDEPPADLSAVFQWTNTVQQASVYLLSRFPEDVAEELFTTPLENPRQVQRLLESADTCVFLPDANKTLAVVAD